MAVRQRLVKAMARIDWAWSQGELICLAWLIQQVNALANTDVQGLDLTR